MGIQITACVLTLVLLTAPLATHAQPAGPVVRIGWLLGGTLPPTLREAFLKALGDLGHVEGRTFALEVRQAEGRQERLRDLAADLVRLRVDVIVTTSESGAAALKQATSSIPIVLAGVADPVGSGLVASLARPGGNVTGVAWDEGPDQATKRVQLAQEIVPGLSRLALLWWPDPLYEPYWTATQAAATRLRVEVRRFDVRAPSEIDGAFAALRAWRADALAVVGPTTYHPPVLELAARHRLPLFCLDRYWVRAGCLWSYGANQGDLVRRAAWYVDRLLKGAKPADLPVEQPTHFRLTINLKTAKALGLTLSPAVRIQADELIE